MKKIILTTVFALGMATVGYASSTLFEETKSSLIGEYTHAINKEITQMDVDNTSDIEVFLTDEKERVRVETLEHLKAKLDEVRKEKGKKQEEAKASVRKEADQVIKEINSEIDKAINELK